MLDFCDKPYRWFPPRDSVWLAPLIRAYNRLHHLPAELHISRVEVSGREHLDATSGAALLFTPNHATHADAAIVIEALHQAGQRVRFMAAYDVFLRRRLDAFVMQRLGAFSVDREGSDRQAMDCAVRTLAQDRRALVIFPEGQVYLQNDVVTPFHDGAAHIALKASKQLAGGGPPVLVVPMSLKVTHLTDVRPRLAQELRAVAALLDCPLAEGMTPIDVLVAVGLVALRRALKQRGLPAPDGDALPQLIEQGAGLVLGRLEEKLELTPRPRDSLVERVRRARRVIHDVRVDPQRVADHAAAATWADEAMVAFRIASYSGAYVRERPTVDRFAETIERLREDLENRLLPPIGPRVARVRFHPPIAVETTGDARQREVVRRVTDGAEAAAQAGLDALNARNREPGAALWTELA